MAHGGRLPRCHEPGLRELAYSGAPILPSHSALSPSMECPAMAAVLMLSTRVLISLAVRLDISQMLFTFLGSKGTDYESNGCDKGKWCPLHIVTCH